MLIGFGQPDTISWALYSPGGTPEFVTSADALTDGKPARATRVQWIDGASSSSEWIELRASWSDPTPVRVVALLGLRGVPVGTAINLIGRRATDLGYTYFLGTGSTDRQVVQLADGSLAVWFVLPEGNDNLTGISFEIFNNGQDLDGQFGPLAVLSFGEAVILQGAEIDIEAGWECEILDPSLHQRTLGGQLASVARRTWRQLQVGLTPAAIDQVRAGGLANGADWASIIQALSGAGRGALIPRWGESTSIDLDEVHRTAVYGRLSAGPVVHNAGDYYGGRWTFEEVPPA